MSKDKTLCLDDWFPRCDGTRTHHMTVRELLSIPELKHHLIEIVDDLPSFFSGLYDGSPRKMVMLDDLKKAISEL